MGLHGQVTGRAARLAWDFGDGTTTTNVGYFTSHTWSTAGVYTVTLTAYNTDNPGGVSCTVPIHVLPITQPPLAAVSWTTNGFQVQFPAQSNLMYTLQRATNLTPPVAWQYVQTGFTNADGVIPLLDSTTTGSAQFYRVQAQ
jgi:PKD repeat protein